MLAQRLVHLVGDEPGRGAAISFAMCMSFDAAIGRAAASARALFQNAPGRPPELDLIGISMGGLIARGLALAAPDIRIARIFTLATPHRGARMAPFVPIEPLAAAMRPVCDFLCRLDAALPAATYELHCYARLRDSWVGARNTAPHDREPYWVPGPTLLSHQTISADPLIRTDIARRLRGEPPLATHGSPPPTQ